MRPNYPGKRPQTVRSQDSRRSPGFLYSGRIIDLPAVVAVLTPSGKLNKRIFHIHTVIQQRSQDPCVL